MPTLLNVDGFSHQTAQAAQAGSGFSGTYENVNRPAGLTFDTAIKRLAAHVAALKIVQDGIAATNVQRSLATQLYVASVYFRIAAAPAGTSQLLGLRGPTNNPVINVNTAGKLIFKFGATTLATTAAGYADSLWHRLDLSVDVSATTYTMSAQIDGVSVLAGGTLAGQTVTNLTFWVLGSLANGDTLTAWYQDYVGSATLADYPIGDHTVLPLYPTGEGTETLGTTNRIQDEAAAQANLYTKVDDWNGGLPNTTDYVTYASTTLGDAASNFAEFAMGDPADSTIWDVIAYLAGFANGTGVDTADTRVYTAHGGTLIDSTGLIDYSGSATVLGYHRKVLARPAGGWTNANLAAAVVQWGYSTDTNAIPRLSAVMLEYAAPAPQGSAALTGTGALSATGLPNVLASAAPAGTGALSAAAVREQFGVASLAGSGSVSAAGLGEALASSAPAGLGALVATAVREIPAAASGSGSGGLTAVGMATAEGVEVMAGVGGLTATGVGVIESGAAIRGDGALTAAGIRQLTGQAAAAGSGTLSATGLPERVAAAALTGQGSASATGSLQVNGEAHLTGRGETIAAAVRERFGTVAMTGEGNLGVVLTLTPRSAPPRWSTRGQARWKVRGAA